MTMSSKHTYSRHVSQCLEKDIIEFILLMAEMKTKWWHFKRRLMLQAAYKLYLLGYQKALPYFDGKIITKWFSDMPTSYFQGGVLYPLNVEEFPKQKQKMVKKLVNAVKDFYMKHNIKHTYDWSEFELYTFDNERILIDGFEVFDKYIFINKNALASKWNRQIVFLHEYCHYVSKGGFIGLRKINEGITDYVASEIAKSINMKYFVHYKYELYYTLAKYLIEQDKNIMIAYLSVDEEAINKYTEELAPIEEALKGKGDLREVFGEYVCKKSHNLWDFLL